MADDLFVFVHIPKTGGQTLRNHFIKHLAFHDEFIHLGPYGIADAERRGLPPFAERPAAVRRRARVLLGHYVTLETHTLVEGKTPVHITFLREPAEMLVSYYNFEMYKNPEVGKPRLSFEEWYETRRGDVMTSWLHTEFMGRPWAPVTEPVWRAVVDTLDRFWFVGTTEFLSDDAPYLLGRIGVPMHLEPANVAGVHYPRTMSLSSELRQRLNAENQFDWRLHQYALARRLQRGQSD